MIFQWIIVSLITSLGSEEFEKRELSNDIIAIVLAFSDAPLELRDAQKNNDAEIARRAKALIKEHEDVGEVPPIWWFSKCHLDPISADDQRFIELSIDFGLLAPAYRENTNWSRTSPWIYNDDGKAVAASRYYVNHLFRSGKKKSEIMIIVASANNRRAYFCKHQDYLQDSRNPNGV
jgi:hypothetical protein